MKILPTNQTLILAAERGLSVTSRAAPAAALRSVTVVAAGSDSPMLYLADYSPPDDAGFGRDAAATSAGQQAPTGSAVVTRSSGGGAGATQNSLKVALYAQTQRLPTAEALMLHVDVYA